MGEITTSDGAETDFMPHGVCATHPDLISADLLAFIRADANCATHETASEF